jgi:hypothetical protein
MLKKLFKSDLIFATMRSSRAHVGEVQAHQTRQFTSNMLEFLFKLDLIFTTTGNLGTQLRKVQVHQMRPFRHVQGKIPKKFGCISQGSSTAYKMIAQVR